MANSFILPRTMSVNTYSLVFQNILTWQMVFLNILFFKVQKY